MSQRYRTTPDDPPALRVVFDTPRLALGMALSGRDVSWNLSRVPCHPLSSEDRMTIIDRPRPGCFFIPSVQIALAIAARRTGRPFPWDAR